MTNPYGNDPGSQAPGLGDPGNQGPQFVAPGSYGPQHYGPPQGQPPQDQPYGQPGPYGAPGSYPPGAYGAPGPNGPQPPAYPYAQGFQQAYGRGFQQQAYGQGYPPAPPQPPRKSSGSTAIVLVVLLALVAGIAVGGYELYQGTRTTPVTQSTPTRPVKATAGAPSISSRPVASSGSSAGPTDCISGDKITTTDFVATVPANWSCDGDDGDISISSTRDDALWVEHDAGSGDLGADCAAQIQDLGAVTTLPQETWGGRTAVAYTAQSSDGIFGARCAVVGSQTWYLMYFPLDVNDDASVRTDVTTVMTTWVWK